jgi:hypothetical protein
LLPDCPIWSMQLVANAALKSLHSNGFRALGEVTWCDSRGSAQPCIVLIRRNVGTKYTKHKRRAD